MSDDRQKQVLLDAYTAGITSPAELANYMAQVTHESLDLNRLNEASSTRGALIKFQSSRLFVMAVRSWKKLAWKHCRERQSTWAT